MHSQCVVKAPLIWGLQRRVSFSSCSPRKARAPVTTRPCSACSKRAILRTKARCPQSLQIGAKTTSMYRALFTLMMLRRKTGTQLTRSSLSSWKRCLEASAWPCSSTSEPELPTASDGLQKSYRYATLRSLLNPYFFKNTVSMHTRYPLVPLYINHSLVHSSFNQSFCPFKLRKSGLISQCEAD